MTRRYITLAICLIAFISIFYSMSMKGSTHTLCINEWLHRVNGKSVYGINRSESTSRLTTSHEPIYSEEKIPTIYAVTPTGKRLPQKADLTRLSYALQHVPNFHWIVVEDGENKSAMVGNLLNRSCVSYTHLNIKTPDDLVIGTHASRVSKPRGMVQRNLAIDWIRQNVRTPGVVYFADDDNTYDLRLFEEMRYTKKVSVWPTAFTTLQRYQSPIVTNGKVTGWLTSFPRPFSTDMSGFAINVQLFHDHPEVLFRNILSHMETDLLEQFNLTLAELEPRADNCTKILVWHTRTENPSISNEQRLVSEFGHGTDENMEI